MKHQTDWWKVAIMYNLASFCIKNKVTAEASCFGLSVGWTGLTDRRWVFPHTPSKEQVEIKEAKLVALKWSVKADQGFKRKHYSGSLSRNTIVYHSYRCMLTHQGRWCRPESPAGSVEISCSRRDPRTRRCLRPGCSLQKRAPAPPPAATPCGHQCGPGWTALWDKER